MSHVANLHTRRPPRDRPRDNRPSGTPDPARLAALVARVFLEVETGRRPLAQLRELLSPELYAHLRGQTGATPRCTGARNVVRATVSRVDADTYDAAVVVRRGARAGSLALRLERRDGAWQVVELARPEDHGTTYQPPPMIVRR